MVQKVETRSAFESFA